MIEIELCCAHMPIAGYNNYCIFTEGGRVHVCFVITPAGGKSATRDEL